MQGALLRHHAQGDQLGVRPDAPGEEQHSPKRQRGDGVCGPSQDRAITVAAQYAEPGLCHRRVSSVLGSGGPDCATVNRIFFAITGVPSLPFITGWATIVASAGFDVGAGLCAVTSKNVAFWLSGL